MNLHGIAAGIVSAVNPTVLVNVQVSTGPGATAPDGSRTPTFATPGSITASIAGSVMTVATVSTGKLLAGQTMTGPGVLSGTNILAQIDGTPGGAGNYTVNLPQTVGSVVAMTTALIVPAQIQALTFRDLQQTEGLNLQGSRHGIYFYGSIEGLVRPTNKGGDLVTFPDGSVWLVAIVLEVWNVSGWCKCAVTLQNR